MTLLRTIVRDLRTHPATGFFCLSWIAVFAAMVLLRTPQGPTPTWRQFLILGVGDAHRFGDLTLADLARGQFWRLVTCNFIHYSLVHIALNLVGFFVLGTMIESWYGAPRLVFIYAATGGLGNLASAGVRYAVGSNPQIHSGGGSVVLMGLIGLVAVVGWRSRHAREGELLRPMLTALGLTALLGVSFPRYIDNWGHAGGLAAGLPLGLADRSFLRNRSRPSAWGFGVTSGLLIAGCAAAQWAADRREGPLRAEAQLRVELSAEEQVYRNLRSLPALVQGRANPRLVRIVVEDAARVLDRGGTRADYRRLLEIAREGERRALTDEQKQELQERALALASSLRRDLEARLRGYWDDRGRRRRERERPRPGSG